MRLLILTSILGCFFTFCFSNLIAQTAPGKRYKKIIIDPSYEHDKWGTQPEDLMYNFAAFTLSFDGEDDNNSDGKGDIWGIPEWVAYEVKKKTGQDIGKYDRPRTWLTDDNLFNKGIAPNDDTYKVSGVNDMKEVKGSYRYVRGHMCPKASADRISMEAGYNTHTTLNAVPQLQWQNNGIWKFLEAQINEWAEDYNRVWVVCGPVFFKKTPAVWLGQTGEVKAAVPDALYKIVIRESGEGVETLAFVVPNVLPKSFKDYSEFLTSIERIESLTGLTFLTNLDKQLQIEVKKKHGVKLSLSQKKAIVDSW